MTPARRPLVVCVGNPLRGDDGVGWAVAERLTADGHVGGAHVLMLHQLTPELAEEVAGASLAVIVDARAGAAPGAVDAVGVAAGGPAPIGHHLGAEGLVGLAKGIYGSVPPVIAVGVGAVAFDAPGLSPEVAAAVPRAAELVERLLAQRLP